MIGYIKGSISAISKGFCFIETGGIGYRVFISEKTRNRLEIGREAKLLTYMAVREDAISLYGFLYQEEYDLFLLLLSISKIGPRLALGILSSMEPAHFIGAVRRKDVRALTKLPGIGKKTAERLLVELADKVKGFSDDEEDFPARDETAAEEGMAGEAAKALMALGYETEEFVPILSRLAASQPSVSALVGAVLRELAKGGTV